MNTIFALSSGQPPAAIAIVRVSGPEASTVIAALAGAIPAPRRAGMRVLRGADGSVLDQALVLWFPGPDSSTGEDLAEFHLHGGRAVIAGVEAALAGIDGVRRAEPGEFTRRAFVNGRIDLAEAEGLADLLAAETELQRRAALDLAGGALSRRVDGWRERLLAHSAALEALLDFSDEDDVASLPEQFSIDIKLLQTEIVAAMAVPRAELLREGFRVVLAGPPNAGKSTLFNALVESEAAITAPSAGTTRDVLVRPVALGGVPFSFVDTAGLRDEGAEEVEAIGIARAHTELLKADLVLWLGPEGEGPDRAWEIEAQIDRVGHLGKAAPLARVSGLTGAGTDQLKRMLVDHALKSMPRPGEVALNVRQHSLLASSAAALADAEGQTDPLLLAENLRMARVSFDRLTGRATTEDLLDTLFGRFCIGK